MVSVKKHLTKDLTGPSIIFEIKFLWGYKSCIKCLDVPDKFIDVTISLWAISLRANCYTNLTIKFLMMELPFRSIPEPGVPIQIRNF